MERERAACGRGAIFLTVILGLAWSGQFWLLRSVTVEADGRAHEAVVLATTVSRAVSQAGLTLQPGDRLRPAGSAPVQAGMTIQVLRAFPVAIAHDGMRTTHRTVGGTVAETLQAAGIALGPLDVVNPAPDTRLGEEQEIRVIRVREEVVTRREEVPHKTLRWAEPSWERGKTGVIRQGVDGLLEHTEKIRYEDGKMVSRAVLSTKVLRKRVDTIIGVGTRTVWRTLKTPAGTIRYREAIEMVATAYYPGPESTGRSADGVTATGMRAGHGVVAVDPRVIPLGTRLYVPGYGMAIAGDVGGAIKGKRIDLGFNTLREALHFGRRTVMVYVLS